MLFNARLIVASILAISHAMADPMQPGYNMLFARGDRKCMRDSECLVVVKCVGSNLKGGIAGHCEIHGPKEPPLFRS